MTDNKWLADAGRLNMLGTLARFKTTIVAAVAVFIWLLSVFTGVDVFESIVKLLEQIESHEIDEISVGFILVLIGVLIDLLLIKWQREQRVEIYRQRLRVLHATMRAVLDVVGNFLNQLQLFRIQAERCKDFPPESIKKLDSMIRETAARLMAIGDLEDTPEKEIGGGVTANNRVELPDISTY